MWDTKNGRKEIEIRRELAPFSISFDISGHREPPSHSWHTEASFSALSSSDALALKTQLSREIIQRERILGRTGSFLEYPS